MSTNDDEKGSKQLPARPIVSSPIPAKPPGGRVSNFVAKVRSWSTASALAAKEHEIEAQTSLYLAVVNMATAHERARLAEVRFQRTPQIVANEGKRLKLQFEVEHQEAMQELYARADALGLKRAEAKLTIDKGLADVKTQHRLLGKTEEPEEELETPIEKLVRERDELEGDAKARWEPKIENETNERDRAMHEESLFIEQTSIREWYAREFTRLLEDRLGKT